MSILSHRLLYHAYHWVKRDGVNAALRDLMGNQELTSEELVELQKNKLKSLLRTSFECVPYYRSLFSSLVNGNELDRLVDPDEFLKIPVLTKEKIRKNLDQLISNCISRHELSANSTSGSTGQPISFYTDNSVDAYRKAAVVRNYSWVEGWKVGDSVVRLWGAPGDMTKASSLRGKLHGMIMRDVILDSGSLSAESVEQYISVIRSHKPFLMISYPSPLEFFASECSRRNVRFDSLRAVVTSAETLWPHQREVIEKSLGVPVYNRYGSREFGAIAHECMARDGLHVNADRLFVEILDDSGQPCIEGQVGEVHITDLHNMGMPMIRYKIGDRAALSSNTDCRCGSRFPMLRKMEGRSMDLVQTATGLRLGGTFWTMLLRSRPGIDQFQVIQTDINGITVKIMTGAEFRKEYLDHFRDEIHSRCGREFEIIFEEVEDIALTESGKARLVISDLISADS